MKDVLSFVKEVEAMLPSQYIIQGIRADCSFADPTVIEYAEEKGWEYIFKLPKKATVKKAISYLQDHPRYWETWGEQEEEIRFATEDDRWAAADIPLLLTNWDKDRRCVIYRESHETEQTADGQLTMTLTIRRIIIKVPENIVGSGRYQHIRLAPNKQLEEILLTMHKKLVEFTEQLLRGKTKAA